uniref:Transmembrane protein n=1 Tax=Oryza sativa subsp. japonica TaxID=39947 RepID=Q69LC2_ORYSJ|nr:hypothetical protein [Oryza sativa Japonica Group]BAD31801.1 hypothetical protein [Oryza sativa Japonica Group]
MGKVFLSDIKASRMEEGKMAAAAPAPIPAESDGIQTLDAPSKLCLTLFITSGAFAIFVACLVLAFVLHLDVTGRVMLVFYALGAVAFGVTGYNIIRLAC